MCDCIKRIEEKLHGQLKGQEFKKPFESVEVEQGFFIKDNIMQTRTYSRAIITLTGQKKKLDTNIVHTFCPFCGEKIESKQ